MVRKDAQLVDYNKDIILGEVMFKWFIERSFMNDEIINKKPYINLWIEMIEIDWMHTSMIERYTFKRV